MALNVGVNVVEVDGRSSPTLQAAETSVAGFVGLTQRGVPNRPVSVTTVAQFQTRFGSYLANGYLAYALEGFFTNGGQTAYVSRVVGAGSAPGSLRLNNRQTTPAPSLQVTAGYRGQADPGLWSSGLRIDIRDDPRAFTQLAASTAAAATSAQLQSLNGVRIGSVLRLMDGANAFARKITAIDAPSRTVSWSSPITPVLNQATTVVTSAEFRILVNYRPSATADFSLVEQWPNLSMESDTPDYCVRQVNQPFTGSQHIVLADLSGGTPVGDDCPAVVSNQSLSGAVENAPSSADFIGDPGVKTGLYALDTVQVQLLAMPDVHTLPAPARIAAVAGALAYCAGRGDCTFVGSGPDRGTPGNVPARSIADYKQLESDYVTSTEAYSAHFQAAKVYGALYVPWIQVNDPIGNGPAPMRFVPPEGAVMGVYARTDLERGIFKAPAGNDALVEGALAVSANFTDAQHTDLVRNGWVNGIRATPGVGIIVAASRTLSIDTRWWYVNVRLLFNFVKSTLRDGLRFVRQEPNSDALQRSVRLNVVTPFLMGLWRQGAFGSDPPAQVFSVKCDAQNNPPSEVDVGNFHLEVYFYPVKPAETILIIVGQQPSGATVAES
jgi:phage tail sheath protein FI